MGIVGFNWIQITFGQYVVLVISSSAIFIGIDTPKMSANSQ